MLYLFATYNFYCVCFWDKYKRIQNTPILLALGIDATLSTVLADATLVWESISHADF